MEQKFIEAQHGPDRGNWGKFLVQRFTEEDWKIRSAVDGRLHLQRRGWGPEHLLVTDLETGEGAILSLRGIVAPNLNKRRIWVCPLFEPFLKWLHQQDTSDLSKLPDLVDLPEAEAAMWGHRRPGPNAALELAADAMKLEAPRANDRTAVAAMLFGRGAEWLRLGLAKGEGEEMPEFSEEDWKAVQAAMNVLGEVWTRTAPPSRPGVVL